MTATMVPIRPDFVLSPCTLDDVEDMISVQESAFADDYFSAFTFPKTIPASVKRHWLRERFTKIFAKPEFRNFKITETSTGKMAAWARWSFPYTFSDEQKLERKRENEQKEREKAQGGDPDWPPGSNLEICHAKFGALKRLREKYVQEDDMYGEFACSEDYLVGI
jgi:hypothetical protein